MRRIHLILCCLLASCSLFAEDISGIWKGTLTQGPGGCYPHYFLELQITMSNDQIKGKAYDYYDKEHFVKMTFTGRYNAQTHRLVPIEGFWLSNSPKIINPYLGNKHPTYKTKMLGCGEIVDSVDFTRNKLQKDTSAQSGL